MSNLSDFFPSGSSIKSIQRGTNVITGGVASTAVGITSVTTAKSILFFLGFTTSGSYPDGLAYIELTNATTITLTKSNSNAVNVSVSWQLVEYN